MSIFVSKERRSNSHPLIAPTDNDDVAAANFAVPSVTSGERPVVLRPYLMKNPPLAPPPLRSYLVATTSEVALVVGGH